MPLNPNPFDQEENLTSWFDRDNLYQNSKKSSLKNFKQSINFQNNIFMSFKDSYTNLVNNITKHAVLATLIMLISLGGVGASAAQLLAPEEFKPSTLIQKTFNPKDFEANKQQEKNPYTALKSDENNDVVLLEKCNLAIKYPKRYENKFNTVVYRDIYSQDQLDYAYIFPKEGELESGDEYFGPSISCSTTKPSELELIDPMYAEVYPEFKDRAVIGKEVPNITVEYIKKNMGWFITEAELTSIRLFDNPSIPGDYTLYFLYKDIHYLIDFQLNDLKTTEGDNNGIIPVIKANQVQIQFNSLVQNEANAEIIEKPKQTNGGSSSSSSVGTLGTVSGGSLTGATFYQVGGSITLANNTYSGPATYQNGDFCDVEGNIVNSIFTPNTGELLDQFCATESLTAGVIKAGNQTATNTPSNFTAQKQASSNASLQTYTNPFFPDFKLVYDSSWKFETTTTSSPAFTGFVNRNLKLTKNGVDLNINIRPKPINSCGLGVDQPGFEKISSFGNSLNKYILNNGNMGSITPPTINQNNVVRYSTTENICSIVYEGFSISSNINGTNAEFGPFVNENNKVQFLVNINYGSIQGESSPLDYKLAIKNDNIMISEIDQIISQSSFR